MMTSLMFQHFLDAKNNDQDLMVAGNAIEIETDGGSTGTVKTVLTIEITLS